MNLYQAGMQGGEQQRPPAYVDRSAHALEDEGKATCPGVLKLSNHSACKGV